MIRDTLQAGEMVEFQNEARIKDKSRLDNLRLECLKLVVQADAVFLSPEGKNRSVLDAARRMFDFVTGAPERPDLFAVKRVDDAKPGNYPALGPLNHLGFNGGVMRWDHEGDAYRFRSKAEAETAIAKYQDHLGGVMVPVQLPDYFEPF